MQLIRPRVTAHRFYLLGRSVHPELYQSHKQRWVQRSSYQVRIDITNDGHVVMFKSGTVTMSEVVCAESQLLPTSRQLLSHPFRSKSMTVSETKHNVYYQTKFEIEQVQPDFFWMIHEQFGKGVETTGLCQKFDSSGRLPWGGLSYVMAEERQQSISIQSLHTFPDSYLLLKASSVFSIDRPRPTPV